MKKLISLALILIMIFSVLPVAAFAFSPGDYDDIKLIDGRYFGVNYSSSDLHPEMVDITEDYLNYLRSKSGTIVHGPTEHEFDGYGWNTKYHWLECACGCRVNIEPHVDPLKAENDFCTCGYQFSDNADLVTLWLQDCKELKNFRKDVYEYETDAFSYKNVKAVKRIATRTFDSEATVELPEDLTLKEGENKFEIKVTAENQKVTKVYTVIVNK